MKILIITFLIILIIIPTHLYSQLLLESTDGFSIMENPIGLTQSNILGAINISEQSLQFRSFINLDGNPAPQRFVILGIKAKPTDGLATLFSNNSFNAGININVGYTKIALLTDPDKKNGIDFINVRYNFSKNKYTIINKDTILSKQINNFEFEGSDLSGSYNYFFGGESLISFGIGYSKTNNYSKLETQELKQINTRFDSVSNTTYEYGKTVNGRMGKYMEIEMMPIKLSYTYFPDENAADSLKLKYGYSFYYSSDFGKYIPIHNLGFILFFTKQSKDTGIRVPILGFGMQLNDLTDNMNNGKPLSHRLSFTLTSVFTIGNLK